MGYSAKAATIRNQATTVGEIGITVNAIDFDAVWSGSNHSKLTGDLSTAIRNIIREKSNLLTYASGLDKLQRYKNNDKRIGVLESEISSIVNNQNSNKSEAQIEADKSTAASLRVKIGELTKENETLKEEIKGIMNSFSSTSSSLSIVTFTPRNIDYDIDIYQLLEQYNNRWGDADGIEGNGLKKLGDGQSLYTLYNEYDENGNVIKGSGKAYVEGLILDIKDKYSGREAAVNTALLMLKLAADKGVKIDYEHKGTTGIDPYVPTSEVASGVDCNPFTSWVVDKGTEDGFQWRPVVEFKSVGKTISSDNWNSVQPGDVFVNDGHVGVIIANNPETGEFICAEASGSGSGIILQTRSYSSLKNNNYQIQDMTSVYDGEEDTDRSIFDQYVDWETYERKV